MVSLKRRRCFPQRRKGHGRLATNGTNATNKLRENNYSPAVNGLATDERRLTQMVSLKRKEVSHKPAYRQAGTLSARRIPPERNGLATNGTNDTNTLRENNNSPTVNMLATDEHGLTQIIPQAEWSWPLIALINYEG